MYDREVCFVRAGNISILDLAADFTTSIPRLGLENFTGYQNVTRYKQLFKGYFVIQLFCLILNFIMLDR
ncbi:hypothetical protein PHET_10652 [Paragonimus heterotremus]|uniref:Uncharacterized protein n=1 Tax=Paragonimus heterotremus TaxID=100268 RepID=A0A8J4SUD8_9TREM|nr:hypothetical protein PHET_10652 [Paragonimus heterotremus]